MVTPISAFPNATALDGTEYIPVLQSGIDKKITVDDLIALATETERIFVKHLTATQTSPNNTPVSITEFEQELLPGTYTLDGLIIYQAAATTTGLQMYVNCVGGTVTVCSAHWYQVTTGGTATTGIGDGFANGSQMLEGKSQRANNTPSGATQGVDTANADLLIKLEGIVTVTATTTLNVMFNSSVTSNVTLQIGSNLLIRMGP